MARPAAFSIFVAMLLFLLHAPVFLYGLDGSTSSFGTPSPSAVSVGEGKEGRPTPGRRGPRTGLYVAYALLASDAVRVALLLAFPALSLWAVRLIG